MATFALIHGGGSTSWDWHLVNPHLENAGHEVVAVDLPIENANAGLDDYVRTVADAIGDRNHVIVVGHSLGGFTASLACLQLRADGLVYLAGMIPSPGESFVEWWTNTGHDREPIDDDPAVSFFNGVSEPLADEARRRERDQQGNWMSSPWPADHHPPIPTLAIVCTDDQFFPAPFMRRQISERLGIAPVEIPGGHYATLTHPAAVAAALNDFAQKIASG
ncbi:alpha/beta fold hydrolase [Okibacterium endophyticum]